MFHLFTVQKFLQGYFHTLNWVDSEGETADDFCYSQSGGTKKIFPFLEDPQISKIFRGGQYNLPFFAGVGRGRDFLVTGGRNKGP